MIMNNLVNFNNPSSLDVAAYLQWLNVGIEHGPLPGPVVAHALMPMDEAALHPVRPNDIGVHAGENSVQPPGVEVPVGAFEECAFIGHGLVSIP